MPVDFLNDEQKSRYGRFSGEPSHSQLAGSFHLADADLAMVLRRRGDHNRLGFAVQLTTVRFLGTFLPDPTDVPKSVVAYLGRQIGIHDISCLHRYLERSTTRHEHAGEIRDAYGYRDFAAQPEHFRFVRWLYVRAWVSAERPSITFDLATTWLVDRKVLLPGATTITRLIAQVRERAGARVWRLLASGATPAHRKRLEALLLIPEGERQSQFDRLRRGPTRISGPALVGALQRYEEVVSLGVADWDPPRVPPSRLGEIVFIEATVAVR